MSVKEVNPLHSRYIELTARFKACWTSQRFHDGLQRFFGRQDLDVETYDFQSLYKRLREASQSIGGVGQAADVGAELDRVDESLRQVTESLDRRDRMISPSLLRLFFQRAKVRDERILIEMVRFYQEAQRDRSWDSDRIDKVDFLVSRLADAIGGGEAGRDRARLDKVLARLSVNVRLVGADPAKIRNRLKVIDSVRGEMREVSSLEQLEKLGLVGHYRDLKHSLGRLFFEASLLPRIIDTNAALSTLVESLWRREEEAIFDEYERIAELEVGGGVGGVLQDAVHRLHTQVGSFRKQMSSGNMRLSELAAVREALTSVDALMADDGEAEERPTAPQRPGQASPLPAAEVLRHDPAAARELVGPVLREILAALATTDPGAGAREVTVQPELAPYCLAPREVTAYRRLTGAEPGNEHLERFLLGAAALRHRLNVEVTQIQGTLGAAPGGVELVVPVLGEVRELLRLGDWKLKQFAHFFEAEAMAGRRREAHGIQRCRMQLMRDLSGLWLEAERVAGGDPGC